MKKFVLNIRDSLVWLVKWLLISLGIGLLIGLIMSGFGWLVTWVTDLRQAWWPIIFGLPFSGLLIVFLYKKAGIESANTGTVMLTVREGNHKVSFKLAPLILLGTVLTHMFGGSSGREGAALQFGGSLGDSAARHLHLNASSGHILMLAAMSASFSALFGTPLAAAIFPMEFISVGVMYYAALVPCMISSFVASGVSVLLGVHRTGFPYEIKNLPAIYSTGFLKAILLGVLCAFIGMLFCEALHYGHLAAKRLFKNAYLRIFVGGCLVVLLALIFQSQTYLGLSEGLIEQSFAGTAPPLAFLFKIIFTILTLNMGFKGGEIVPSFVIGATFGCLMSGLLGLPVGLAVACGMCGVFCAVTNSPITSILIAFELFGFEGAGYFGIVVAISYMLSGYVSLFSDQRIVYSKFETRYINKWADSDYTDVRKHNDMKGRVTPEGDRDPGRTRLRMTAEEIEAQKEAEQEGK